VSHSLKVAKYTGVFFLTEELNKQAETNIPTVTKPS